METERIPALTLDDLRYLEARIAADITLRETEALEVSRKTHTFEDWREILTLKRLRETHTLKPLRELKERISREITSRETHGQLLVNVDFTSKRYDNPPVNKYFGELDELTAFPVLASGS